jgi:hypothetical protein
MTAYAKPTVRSAWAETATVNDITDPGNTYASTGWALGVKPPRQYMNWVLNYTFEGVRYLCQTGVPAWDSAENYYAAAGSIVQRNNILYQAASDNINKPPESNPVIWLPISSATPASNANNQQVANTAWTRGNFIAQGAGFGAISGNIANGQVPASAVTQWQGVLSIAGSQVSSAVTAANTILINGGYRTINWVSQPGQPAELIGSNDGATFAIWSPSNFSVANSAQLAGLSPSAGAGGSTIAERDSSGYLFAQNFNQASANNENPSISQVMVTNGSDGFLRKAALAAFGLASNPTSASANGWTKLPGGLILQWGTVTVANPTNDVIDVRIFWPTAWNNGMLGAWVSTHRSVAGNGQAIHGSGFTSGEDLNGMTITIDSSGGGVSTGRWFAIGH